MPAGFASNLAAVARLEFEDAAAAASTGKFEPELDDLEIVSVVAVLGQAGE